MNHRRRETDALVRHMRAYGALFMDPRPNFQRGDTVELGKLRAGQLMVDTFADLDEHLKTGADLPEEWDAGQRFVARHRFSAGNDWARTYPPGCGAGWSCDERGRSCKWLDRAARASACARCHTIRYRTDEPYVI